MLNTNCKNPRHLYAVPFTATKRLTPLWFQEYYLKLASNFPFSLYSQMEIIDAGA